MLRKRLIVVILGLPILILFVVVGGEVYSGFIGLLIGVAAWEFWRMFKKGGYFPSAAGTIGGAVILSLRSYFDFISFDLLLTLLVMVIMTIHIVNFERGRKESVLGFCITSAGMIYWGLMGGYLLSLRQLPDGLWWVMLVLPSVWAADVGGYFGGTLFGRHPMTPRLSPKKTWEGYVGGIVMGLAFTALFGLLWHGRAERVTWQTGLVIGGFVAVFAPLGDLGASMFKRMFNLKDSSNLLPGHGGIMDRIDSWIWGAAIGFFYIVTVVY